MAHDIVFDTKSGTFLNPSNWQLESRIDETVLAFPEIVSRLLTGGDDYVVALAGANFGGPQLLKIDALLLLDEGDVAPRLVVWESKREGNVHPRTLMGQVIDYVSALASMPPEDFAHEMLVRSAQPSWRESYEASFRRRGLPIPDIGSTLARASDAHRDGRFVLVVCAESIPEDVVRMSQWLTKQMKPMSGTYALPVDFSPVGADGWVRAAALLHVVSGVEADPLDQQFDKAVQRLMQVRGAEFLPVEAKQLKGAAVSFSTLVEPPSEPRPKAASAISLEAWKASATPEVRALHERLTSEFPESVAEWNVGNSALLLYLRAGEQLVEGLRLFGNRIYFVSEKSLSALGADDDVRWWRATLSTFPVTDPNAKQPVVAGAKVAVLLAEQDRLVAFLRELQFRAQRAASPKV